MIAQGGPQQQGLAAMKAIRSAPPQVPPAAGEGGVVKRARLSGGAAARGGPARLEDCADPRVLHRSSDFVVLDKPADVRLDGPFAVTLERLLARLLGPDATPKWVHQLDFATSGVLCVGLNRVAAGNAGRLFSGRETRKFYLAVVRGWLRPAAPLREAGAALSLTTPSAPTWLAPSLAGAPVTPLLGAAIAPPAAASATTMAAAATTAASSLKYATALPDERAVSVEERWESRHELGREAGCLLDSLLRPMYGDAPTIPCFQVDGAITEEGDEDDFRMKIDSNRGLNARTQVVPVAYGTLGGVPATKVLLRPLEGRRHQLRLHTLHLGFPVLGDATYG
jgi:23S rRNA-/tRNA-specific pseudouridylate synthase